MKRYFFFVLFFPAAFMNLMLVQASPSSLVKYFLAGYVVAVLPAMLMVLICEMATNRSPTYKAGWCAVAAFITSPLMLATPWKTPGEPAGEYGTVSAWDSMTRSSSTRTVP